MTAAAHNFTTIHFACETGGENTLFNVSPYACVFIVDDEKKNRKRKPENPIRHRHIPFIHLSLTFMISFSISIKLCTTAAAAAAAEFSISKLLRDSHSNFIGGMLNAFNAFAPLPMPHEQVASFRDARTQLIS